MMETKRIVIVLVALLAITFVALFNALTPSMSIEDTVEAIEEAIEDADGEKLIGFVSEELLDEFKDDFCDEWGSKSNCMSECERASMRDYSDLFDSCDDFCGNSCEETMCNYLSMVLSTMDEMGMTNLNIRVIDSEIDGDSAIVTVRATMSSYYGRESEEGEVEFVKEGGKWKVANIEGIM